MGHRGLRAGPAAQPFCAHRRRAGAAQERAPSRQGRRSAVTYDPRAERTALIAAAAGLGACALGGIVSGADAFFQSYLVGAVFWIEIAFGCLGIQMIHTLTSGGWGTLARRPLSAASSTMPLCALLFA